MKTTQSCKQLTVTNPPILHSSSSGNLSGLTMPDDDSDHHFLQCTNKISKKVMRKLQKKGQVVDQESEESYDSQSDEDDYLEEKKTASNMQKCQEDWSIFLECYFKNLSKRGSLRSVYNIFLEKIKSGKLEPDKQLKSGSLLITEEDLKRISEVETNVGARKVSRFWNNLEPLKRPLIRKAIPKTELVKSKQKEERGLNTMLNKGEACIKQISIFDFKPMKAVEKTPCVAANKLFPNAPYKKAMQYEDKVNL